MEFKIDASTIGTLADKVLRERDGRITIRHVFRDTIYLDAGRDMLILTMRTGRSPIVLNAVRGELDKPLGSIISLRDPVFLEGSRIIIGKLAINTEDAAIYSPSSAPQILDLDDRYEEKVSRIILKGIEAISILYSISSTERSLPQTDRFRDFFESVVIPFSIGETGSVFSPDWYKGLLGFGEGFTPAGDDFLSGFISVTNMFHRVLQIPRLKISETTLSTSTTWASRMFLRYVQDELYDEESVSLLKSIALAEEACFMESLFQLTRRGHSSGLDMVLGVITALASIIDNLCSSKGKLTQIVRSRMIKH